MISPESSSALPRVVELDAPAASPPPTSLLDSLTARGTGEARATFDPAVDRFLRSENSAERLQIWLGSVPASQAQRTQARQVLARDIGRIDAALAKQVDEILHHPDFQSLEAGYRGLYLLWEQRRQLLDETSMSDSPAEIELRVLSVTKKELIRDFEDAVEFDQNNLFKKVYEEEFGTPGGTPYGTLIANYEFTNHPADIDLLDQLSGVGAAAFAPVLVGAAPALLGLDDFSALEQPVNLQGIFGNPKYRKWNALREKTDTQFLGITLPHILMREPYQDDGIRPQGFRYAEAVGDADNRKYLWGTSAWAMGTVLMRAFAACGWFADIRGFQRGVEGGGLVNSLATHQFGTDPWGSVFKSSVDVAIPEQREAELCDLGFIPLLHAKGTPFSVFYSNQSVHAPGQYQDASATNNARLACMLQYVLCCSRIAHYLKVRARDKIGSRASAREIADELSRWLVQYVTPDDRASPSMKARYPLREANVEVDELPGKPGHYSMTIHLLPHYQLDQLSSTMTLMARRVDLLS